MNEIEIEDKEELIALLWKSLSEGEYASDWSSKMAFADKIETIGLEEWTKMAEEYNRQRDEYKAEVKRMAGDEKGYGFTHDELLKLEGKARINKIIDIVNERYIGGSFALLGAREFDDVMSRIYQDVQDIGFMCDILEVTKKFAFQKTRRLHYNKRTKKYYFT